MNIRYSTRAIINATAIMLATLATTGCGGSQSDVIEASGTVEATDITISPLVSGTVLRVYVREGSRVRAGDTLARIDAADLELQRNSLLAALDITQAQYALLRNGPRPEDLGQATAAMTQAQVALDNSIEDLRRLEPSFAAGAIPEKAITDARARVATARAALRSTQLAVDRIRNGSRAEDLQAGRARETQAESQLLALDKKISDCFVRAPIDGVITSIAIDRGEFAMAGGGMMTLSRTDEVEVTIYVPESDLGRVRLGQRADLAVDSYADRKFDGRVVYISPQAEFTPRNVQTKDDRVKQVFAVKIVAANPDGALKAGLTADARLTNDTSVRK